MNEIKWLPEMSEESREILKKLLAATVDSINAYHNFLGKFENLNKIVDEFRTREDVELAYREKIASDFEKLKIQLKRIDKNHGTDRQDA